VLRGVGGIVALSADVGVVVFGCSWISGFFAAACSFCRRSDLALNAAAASALVRCRLM